MNHRDVWFVGLLALAYLYLDAAAPAGRRDTMASGPIFSPRTRHPARDDLGYSFMEACPRDISHTVSLRADGAKWCLACDEAFYPALS